MNLIVFVHGALATPKSWTYHKQILKNHLKEFSVFDYSYDIERDTSESICDDLALKISGIKGLKRVFFICHSFGGVISIETVRILQYKYTTEFNAVNFKVLTISSPLGGSDSASYMRILKPYSLFLRNVGTFDSFMKRFRSQPLPCKVHCIASVEPLIMTNNSDGVVTLDSQLYYKNDPNCTVTIVDGNHFEVLMCPIVSKEIKNFLKFM